MKTRNGFVSNSSSSSFLLLGIKREEEIDGFDADQCSYKKYYYGNTLVYGLDDESDFEIDFSELSEKSKQIAEKFNVDISEVKLYIDTSE